MDAYVQGPGGELISFDDLTAEQQRRCATELKGRYLGELFRGQAVFSPAGEGAE